VCRRSAHCRLMAAGRDDEALEQLKKVLELDQNQLVALVSMAMIYADAEANDRNLVVSW